MESKQKKTPRWLKVIFWLSGGFFVLVFGSAFLIYAFEPTPEINSWEQWKQHKEYIESLSNNVVIAMNATTVYAKANDYYKDRFYNGCNLDVCSEYKGFIRSARDASSDGVLTPRELVVIAEHQAMLKMVIVAKNKEFKEKFEK